MPKAEGLQDLYIQSDEQMPNVVRTQMDVVLSHGMEHWHPDPAFFFKPGGGPVLDKYLSQYQQQ